MDLMYESGLFSELGEVVGYDPVLYEDTQKQHFNTSLLTDGLQKDVGNVINDSSFLGSTLPGMKECLSSQ